MIRRYLIVFAIFLIAIQSLGQGRILFANNTATAITNFPAFTRASTNTRVSLYVNANSNALWLDPGWSHIYTTNLIAPGIFLGGIRTLSNSAGDSYPAFSPVAVQVRAWFAEGIYENFNDALQHDPRGQFGISQVMIIAPSPDGAAPPVTLTGSGLQPFYLYSSIPEPSSALLVFFGAIFLIGGCSRRRLKKNPSASGQV